jgi:hypothetical protein
LPVGEPESRRELRGGEPEEEVEERGVVASEELDGVLLTGSGAMWIRVRAEIIGELVRRRALLLEESKEDEEMIEEDEVLEVCEDKEVDGVEGDVEAELVGFAVE